MPAISVVIVAYRHAATVVELCAALAAGTRPPDEIVVVDNAPERDTLAALAGSGTVAVAPPDNGGYAGGCNAGAAVARGELLVFLNPDCAPLPTLIAELAAAFAGDPESAIVGAQVLLPGGATTNAGANPLHPSGISWSGRLGEHVESGPPRPALAISGTAFAVRREIWDSLGGFREEFFLYCEDTDLCWRARLAGHSVTFAPEARVVHDYAFAKPDKWRYLERNRLRMVATLYAPGTLVALAPVLAATELGVLIAAVRGGWLPQKRRAYAELWHERSALAGARRRIQRTRRVADADLLSEMAWRISSPLLEGPLVRIANPAIAAYGTLAQRLLRPHYDPAR